MKKICFFTGTRAEYGLLKNVMLKVKHDPDLKLQIVACGMHCSPDFGYSIKEIEEDGFNVDEKLNTLMSSDTDDSVCKSMGMEMILLSDAFARLNPDICVVLGDRYESFVAASVCVVKGIPVAHLYGGEITKGAIDEQFRHAITKMSHLHFVSTDIYRKRVIQMGEDPLKVFNVGSLGVENIKGVRYLSVNELSDFLHFDLSPLYIVVTFHSETLSGEAGQEQVEPLIKAIEKFDDIKFLITLGNSDPCGKSINFCLKKLRDKYPDKICVVSSLGMQKYLSAVKNSIAVVGNSSSGIIEAPSFCIPTVNIGLRQSGRVRSESVMDCENNESAIFDTINKAMSKEFRARIFKSGNVYESENTSLKIVEKIKLSLKDSDIKIKKFIDIMD
jgi:GDP/UDP-N,N'-diacetylbacillosamine 2-epimerase (hydrolysing)